MQPTYNDVPTKSPTQRLDDLYKWLLAPTTFLVLAVWNEVTYIVTFRGELNATAFLPSGWTEADLLVLPIARIAPEVTSLVLSVFIFLIFSNQLRGQVWLVSRFLSFWGITFTLLSLGYTFMVAINYPPFTLLPIFQHDIQRGIALGSLTAVLSVAIVLNAYSQEKTHRQRSSQ